MSAPTATLVADEDRNPLQVVLGTYETIRWYVSNVLSAIKKWPSMKPTDRMTFLTNLALRKLEELQVPLPFKVGATQDQGWFIGSTWSMYLMRPLFSRSALEDIADQAAHVLHESEHLAATYVAARYLAAGEESAAVIAKTLYIASAIAKKAASEPLPPGLMKLGKACHFRVTSEKTPPEANNYYRHLRASIRKSQVEIKRSEEELAALERSDSSSRETYANAYAKKRKLENQLEKLVREYRMSNVEIGSGVVSNLVKSMVLREAKGAR